MQEITLYTCVRNNRVTGVFTTEDTARRCAGAGAELRAVRAMQMPGSPAARGWAVSARGSWNTLCATAQGVHAQTICAGPCWGMNVQSAIAGLFSPRGDLRMGCVPRPVKLTSLRFYRLDQDDGSEVPENLAQAPFASRCMHDLHQHGAISADALAEDFIAQHECARQRHLALHERLDSGLPALLAEHMLTVACARARGKRGFCGAYLSRVARSLDLRIAQRFTLPELQTLCALLKLQAEPPAKQTSVPEEEAALLARLEQLTPSVRRTTGRRDAHEDPAEIARWILHPEAMILQGPIDLGLPTPINK